MNTATTTRINMTIPTYIWSELEQAVPERKKSSFVAEAIEEKLRVEKKKKAFADLASLPATFVHIADGAEYTSTTRKKDAQKRTKQLSA